MKAKLMLLKTMTAISIRRWVARPESSKGVDRSHALRKASGRATQFLLWVYVAGVIGCSSEKPIEKPKEAEKWFRRRDVDGDGVVSLTEFAPPLPISMTKPESKGDADTKDGPAKTQTEQPQTEKPPTSEPPTN